MPCLAFCLAAAPAGAQVTVESLMGTGELHDRAPSIRAARRHGPVVVDGRLNEPAWELASPATEFTQVDPEEGAPASERTEVRVLYDADALYIGARLYDRAGVSTRLARRDATESASDHFSVAFDSYHDHQTAFRFRINPSGVRGDEILTGGFLGDDSWDPVWEAETAVTDSGWVAELRIPFSQLRFSSGREQVWGIQLERVISRTRETAVFSFTPKSQFGGIARYGHLEGIEGIRQARRLEVMPYVVARGDRLNTTPEAFGRGSEYSVNGGMDLKYRLASNFTVDATLNPDFGQVELDPAEINLTPFESYFQEKRPFFVEGAEVFQFGENAGAWGGTQLLYSRRIGRAPGLWPGDAIHAVLPVSTTILGAAKLTGKTPGGWSVGILNAVTDHETAAYVDALGAHGSAMVEPRSNYFAARLERDLRGGRSSIGGMITAVHRDLETDFLASQLRSAAYTGGVDFRHEWADRAWSLQGYVAGSRISGEPAVLLAAQRSSARYFQRPDASHLRLDPDATALTGYLANLELSKRAGRHWRGRLALSAVSPGLEINDLGFQTAADRVEADLNVRYLENRPGTRLRSWSVAVGPELTWNYGGDLLERGVRFSASGQTLRYLSGGLTVRHAFAGLDDRLTRGGPLVRSVPSTAVSANLHSDPRKSWTGFAFGSYGSDGAGGRNGLLGVNLGLKPASNVSVRVGPTLTARRTTAQYTRSLADSTAPRTFGRRYVFADLDQATVGLETRLNVVFTPGLSLELYAQPFLSSGDYGGLKELSAPRTFSFDVYGADIGTVTRDARGTYTIDPDASGPAQAFKLTDPNFTFRSLRGNAVLRWEWRAGSTLFLVWQQRRAAYLSGASLTQDSDRVGRIDAADVREIFSIPPDNVIVIKLSYWLNP